MCEKDKSQTGCKFGEKCPFLQKETERQAKKAKDGGGKRFLTLIRNVKQSGSASQDAEPPNASAMIRKGTNSMRRQEACSFRARNGTLRKN